MTTAMPPVAATISAAALRTRRLIPHLYTSLRPYGAIQRQQAGDQPPRAEFADYVRELQRIALGQDASGRARDRLGALKELLKLEKRGTSSYIEASSPEEPELQRRWARIAYVPRFFMYTQFGDTHYYHAFNGNAAYSDPGTYYDTPYCGNRDSTSHYVDHCNTQW